MMKAICSILLVMVFYLCHAGATTQVGEILEINGRETMIDALPLEKYFSHKRKRPEFPALGTACYRGYVGNWSIWGDQLFLISLHEWHGFEFPGEKIPLKKVFPSNSSPRLANWFDGVIQVHQGKRMKSIHDDYESISEKDFYLTIKSGKVTSKKEIDNKGFGATRSYFDLEWVFLAPNPFPDDGDWTDGRLLENETYTKWITTRGSFRLRDREAPAHLYIYETPTTRGTSIELEGYVDPMIREYCHVEVRGVFDKGTRRIQIQSIRRLRPGESIHHGKFQPPKNEFDGKFPDWR